MLEDALPMFEKSGRMRCVRECRELLGAQCERFAALRYSPALSPNAIR